MSDLKKLVSQHREKVEKIISRMEIAGLLTTILAVALMTKQIAFGNTLLIIGLSVLAWVYAFLGTVAKELFNLRAHKLFAAALLISYYALAATMLGMLFILMRWQGSLFLMQAGSMATGGMFTYFIYKSFLGKLDDATHRTIINNLIVRMLPALLVTAILIAVYLKT